MAEKRPYQTFNLPKDELLQSKWLYNLNRPKTYTNPETGNLVKIKQKNLAVCIRHFRWDDFELTSSDKEKGRTRFGSITCQQKILNSEFTNEVGVFNADQNDQKSDDITCLF
jgi:hypothetical protein